MASMLVRQHVANFETWKGVFDRFAPLRKEYGLTGHHIHREAADPNRLVVLLHADDMDAAKRYAASQELHAAMHEAGVQGPPEVTFLDDVEDAA